MPRLSVLIRALAIGQFQAGRRPEYVAEEFDISPQAMRALIRKFHRTGDVKDMHRSGRPKKNTANDDRAIRINSLRNHFKSSESSDSR